MMTIILSITFFILGCLTRFIKKSDRNPKNSKFLRRGLITKQYHKIATGENFDVEYEIGEIERSNKKSKVNVISCVSSNSDYNDDKSKEKYLIPLIKNSWIDSNDIEWIIENQSVTRDKKINEILNK